ncbi:hypothetical protein [Staphylospora marina]|uniref:hypothetical protein n=1 Tax=Staphylospora marina TaxID=2490858 RepID=UPI000F5B9A65|nr:hypothetical protein [Staphylospora marina]
MKLSAKYMSWVLVTVLAELGLTWWVGKVFSMLFEEIVFFVAVICLAFVSFFSGKGGYFSVNVN